jgi:hypothetical protein
MDLEKNQLEAAKRIVAEVEKELLDSEDEYCGAVVTVFDNDEDCSDGVLFSYDENCNPEHVAKFAQALLDELEIDEPHVFSWAYICSRPRIGEFGGGACVVARGRDPFWVDAQSVAAGHAAAFKR